MAKRTARLATRLPALHEIERSIFVFRGQRVMVDSDLAALYGVPTSALNQAVNRNAERFPFNFSFVLTQQEFMGLISQSVISNEKPGGRRKRPRVFTEQGVAMLSSVLRSPTAVEVNIAIMRTFVRIRRLMATPGESVEQLTKLADAVKLHDDQIKAIANVLERMVEQAPLPRRRIGFHADDGRT